MHDTHLATAPPWPAGGHYTAMCCLAEPGGGGEAWYSFNDDAVARVKPEQVVSQYAYILC